MLKTQTQIGSSPNTQDVDVAWPMPLSEGKLHILLRSGSLLYLFQTPLFIIVPQTIFLYLYDQTAFAGSITDLGLL